MTALKGLAAALRALDRLDLAPLGRDTLGQTADTLAGAVRQALSHAPGEDHATPWLRTGKLRASITCEATDTVAVIGSSDPVAVYQELGTSAIAPRPFLASVAAAEADGIARSIANRIRAGFEG